MKALADATTIVYLSEARPMVFSKLGLITIQQVLEEVKYLVKDPVTFNEITSQLVIVEVLKTKLTGEDESLSIVDSLLIQTAVKGNHSLVSDDMKLLSIAKQNGCKAMHTPRFIESIVGSLIELGEAKEILRELRLYYIRKKAIEVVLRRLEKWR